MTVISVIVGSTRQGRFSENAAQWIFQRLKNRGGVEARLLDLRDFPMPFFDQPMPPAMPGRPTYDNEVVKKWTAEIARSDGFISSRQNTIMVPLRCSRTHSTGFIRSGTARRPPS